MEGLKELLAKHKETELTEEQFEAELNKILPKVADISFSEHQQPHKQNLTITRTKIAIAKTRLNNS